MKRRHSERPHIVILGGGFAGLAAALELHPDRFRVTLVDRNDRFEFLPNIHELLSGVKTPDLLRLSLDLAMRRAGHRFLRDTVLGIDPHAQTVAMKRRAAIGYDALIVSLGGVDAARGVPGVFENAMPFKSVAQCQRISKRLAMLARGRRRGRVVIVGGGLEGVEALGEVLRRYRDSGLRVSMVEGRDRLLAESPASVDAHVRKLCSQHDVEFRMNSRVQAIEREAVVLDGGESIASDLTIWTGGPAPPALLANSGFAPRGVWAPVAATLQSAQHPDVFIAGDAAGLPANLPKQAYHALDMGVCASRNVARQLSGRPLELFRPSAKPTLVSFGDLSCFLIAGGIVLAGPSLGLAKEAVYELVMARLDAQPVWKRLPGVVERAESAARALVWPTLSSVDALRRQAHLSLLSFR